MDIFSVADESAQLQREEKDLYEEEEVQKVDIHDVLRHIGNQDYGYINEIDIKQFQPFVLNLWMSHTDDLVSMIDYNRYINTNVFRLDKKGLYCIACAVSEPNTRISTRWIKGKKNETPITDKIKKYIAHDISSSLVDVDELYARGILTPELIAEYTEQYDILYNQDIKSTKKKGIKKNG